MNTLAARGRALWGGFLVILGGVLLLEYFVELGVWPWVIFLTLFGLGFYALYAADRKHKWLLIPSYVLLTIAGLLTLTELDVLRGDVVAIYVFVVIAIPFLFVYLRNRRAWWALIPAYVMLALTGLIGLDALGVFPGDTEVSYIMFAIAFPFFFVYVRNTRMWWALIPGVIMAIIGGAFLFTAEIGRYIGPAFIILIGVWILFRAFVRPQERVSVSVSGFVEDMEDMASQIESDVEEGVAGLMDGLEEMGVVGESKDDEPEQPADESTEGSEGGE